MNNQFWKDKKVVLTGHTGFKGGWLALWLNQLGAKVTGISLPPDTTPSLFHLARVSQICDSHICDIRDAPKLLELIDRAQPDIVFHLAAQPLVRASYSAPLNTFNINVMGTANVLEALAKSDTTRVGVMITTDKVYRNNEWHWPYREDDHLGGHDPYSASKAACEIVIASYRDSFLTKKGIAVASARAGNVIGGGDWAMDRLIPDAIRAWQSDKILEIRRPSAIRPWQHVLEPLSGYLRLAEKLWHNSSLAGAYNFGPNTTDTASVRDVINIARKSFGSGEVKFGDSAEGPHEAGHLALEVAKSHQLLGIKPVWPLVNGVHNTISWYKDQLEGLDANTLCLAQISAYEVERDGQLSPY